MTDRALRLKRLRRRVAVGAVATFAGAFGTVAATGSMGTSTAAGTTAATSSAQSSSADDAVGVQTAQAPSAVTSQQS